MTFKVPVLWMPEKIVLTLYIQFYSLKYVVKKNQYLWDTRYDALHWLNKYTCLCLQSYNLFTQQFLPCDKCSGLVRVTNPFQML